MIRAIRIRYLYLTYAYIDLGNIIMKALVNTSGLGRTRGIIFF